MRQGNQAGYTLIGLLIAIVLIGIISKIVFTGLREPIEQVKANSVAADASKILAYVERVRLSPVSTTSTSVVYPNLGKYQNEYLSNVNDISVPKFRADVENATGRPSPSLPKMSPWDTPYKITLQDDNVSVSVVLPITGIDLLNAVETEAADETTFVFHYRRGKETTSMSRTTGAEMIKVFLTEDVR